MARAFDSTGDWCIPGPLGVFNFKQFLEDVRVLDPPTTLNALGFRGSVTLYGASQGAEIAFHALARCPRVAGAVCMPILLDV